MSSYIFYLYNACTNFILYILYQNWSTRCKALFLCSSFPLLRAKRLLSMSSSQAYIAYKSIAHTLSLHHSPRYKEVNSTVTSINILQSQLTNNHGIITDQLYIWPSHIWQITSPDKFLLGHQNANALTCPPPLCLVSLTPHQTTQLMGLRKSLKQPPTMPMHSHALLHLI